MANYYYSIPSIFIIHLLICLSCYCIGTTHAIADASLLPKRPSNRPTTISTEANRRRGKGRRRGKVSAIIINRWSPLNKYNNIPVDEQQVLEWDAHRAKSIQARFRARRNEVEKEAPVKLPAIPGSQIKSASFVVQVKIGKIKNDQLLIFDTGSKLTWVQCVSCKPKNCYKQNSTTYFDPIASGSRKIECASGSCQKFDDYQQTSCSTGVSQCGFNVRYADGSSVSGDFFKDVLGLGNQVVSNDYIFGCANKFVDPTPGSTSFHGSTGIMGLHGGNPVSVIDQSTNKFHKSFSYCLPTGMYNYGHLTFGPSLNSKSRFEATIPMKGGKDAEYIVALVGITVGKTRLKIAPTVFSEGALIDTGSVMTWLPKSAYDTLQAEYVKQMGEYKYSRLPGKKSTEACYDLSSYPTPAQIPIPTISLHFEAGKNEQTFRISDKGVMGGPMKRRCLWFAPNEPDDDVSIIGSYAQQTFNFVFDLEKNTILVGPLGCK